MLRAVGADGVARPLRGLCFALGLDDLRLGNRLGRWREPSATSEAHHDGTDAGSDHRDDDGGLDAVEEPLRGAATRSARSAMSTGSPTRVSSSVLPCSRSCTGATGISRPMGHRDLRSTPTAAGRSSNSSSRRECGQVVGPGEVHMRPGPGPA